VSGGNLVARIARTGSTYRGVLMGTIDYEHSYGPYRSQGLAKAQWQPPYRIEMRALMPKTPGAWAALWEHGDVPDGHELDVAEEFMWEGKGTTAHCAQHKWRNGQPVRTPFEGRINVSNMATNWHVYSATVTTNSVTYRVDNQVCGVAWGIPATTWNGAILMNMIGDPGSWAGQQQPSPSDPGPWDMKVDYVRVTKL
jgi:hypothetical protein